MKDPQARALLEEVIAHADDDTPRLIFADWLEEHGDSARAEFIRVQIERASLPAWDARQVRLSVRELELLKQHGQIWRQELPSIKGIEWGGFRRGFVAYASFSSFSLFDTEASACWAAAPIENVSVRWPRQRPRVQKISPIPGLRELTMNSPVFDVAEVRRLADAPLLSTIRTLNVHGCNLGAAGFASLVTSTLLGNLKGLHASSNAIGDEGLSALFDAKALSSLEELDLSDTSGYNQYGYGNEPMMNAASAKTLATWPGLAKLRSLTISGNDVGRDGLRTLLRSRNIVGLKELTLRDNRLDGQAMAEFGEAHAGLQLEKLDLGENLLKELGAAYLASAVCLRDLKVLRLDRCELPPAAGAALAKAKFLNSLRKLNVNDNNLRAESLQALLDRKPQHLHTLEMFNNELGDEGVIALAESPASDTLLEVNLGGSEVEVGAAALMALAKSAHLQQLLVLRLYYGVMHMDAAAVLAESPLGKRLAVLQPSSADEDIPF